MSYGRGKMLLNSDVLTPKPVQLRGVVRNPADDPRDELDALRSTNARLLRELAALKEREAQALRLADRDGLTGLYNRRRMLELLDQTVADASADGYGFAVLFIDLDG